MGQFIPVPNLDAVVARSAPVKENIAVRGRRALAAAKAKLAGHRDEGHAKVTGRMAREDYLLYLDDTRGRWAALSIEFGTRGTPQYNEDGSWSAAGTRPLRIITGAHVRRSVRGDSIA